MELATFADDVLKLNPKIRYVGVYYHADLIGKHREGLESMLTEDESMRSLRGSVIRMNSRKALQHKLGLPRYGLALYDKIFRITFPLKDDDILLISIDSDCDIMDIINKIIPLQQSLVEELYQFTPNSN